MNKTEFQANNIRETGMSKAFEQNYGDTDTAWPFPTGVNAKEVFYEHPRVGIRRFQLTANNPDPSYDQTDNELLQKALKSVLATSPGIIVAIKPDRSPPRLLTDTTDGLHPYHGTKPYQRKETDPNGKDPNTPGAKVDAGKDRAWLFLAGFSRALKEVAKVATVGANKYTPDGWVSVPDGRTRYMDAFGRHLLDFGTGARIDDGPGGTHCLHQAQMIWNLLAALELELREKENGTASV